MGELLVMMMAIISPSRRGVSLAEQLRRSPRLVSAKVPPRDGGVWSRKPPYDFFPGQNTSYRRRWASGGHRGAHEAGGVPREGGRVPHPRGQVVAPLADLFRQIFFIFSEMVFHGVSELFELCRIGLQCLLLFQPRIPAVGILPLHVNLVK